ncbi:MAG TPA: nucleotidyltransferase family protein [Thermoanaerobaculia bacterium]
MEAFQVNPVAAPLREPLRAALRGERADWPPLSEDDVRTLVDHGVAPLVYAAQPLEPLRTAAIHAAAIEPLRAADLREVLAALAARGIRVLILKGTALAYDVYAAPELRPRGDVDLLVSREQSSPAIEAFGSLGFAAKLTSGDEHNVRQVTFARGGHEYDLHWDIANSPLFASALTFDSLQIIPLPPLGEHAFGLSHPDALLLACIHRVAHHHDLERLIWLVDITLLRTRMSREEHARFWRQAADARVVAICQRSIELANEWMWSGLQPAASEFLTEEELTRPEPSQAFLDPNLRYGDVMLANLRALPWRARLQRVWQLAFPPRAFMHQTLGNGALPWLYVKRGVRGVRRLFKRMV